MLVVDPRKVRAVSEALRIEEDISMLSIERGLKLPRAYLTYAAEELEHALVMSIGDSGWCSCFPIHRRFFLKALRGSNMPTGPMDLLRMAKSILDDSVFGRAPEIVAVGAMIRLLDSKADISLDPEGFQSHYTSSEWPRVVEAVPFCHWDVGDPDQPGLYEQPEATENRRLIHDLRTGMRSLIPPVPSFDN